MRSGAATELTVARALASERRQAVGIAGAGPALAVAAAQASLAGSGEREGADPRLRRGPLQADQAASAAGIVAARVAGPRAAGAEQDRDAEQALHSEPSRSADTLRPGPSIPDPCMR